MRHLFLWIALLLVSPLPAQFTWQEYPTGTQASLRGIATAQQASQKSAVIWSSGASGSVLRTLDAGKSWQSVGPTEYSKLDFRSLHAWDENRAIIASAGTPALVLKTSDGGTSWRKVFDDARPAAFFDGLKFIDSQRGVLFGDPIDGRFCVFTTQDAGDSWQAIAANALPEVRSGEAAFAASNSAMIAIAPSTILIGTGGTENSTSRILRSNDFGAKWQVDSCALVSNKSSGIFSLAFDPAADQLVAVGGDYEPNAKSETTSAVGQMGQQLVLATQPIAEYRSSVVYSAGNASTKRGFYAAGPTGTDYSSDGRQWRKLSSTGYHALAVLPDQGIIGVGSNGRFGIGVGK